MRSLTKCFGAIAAGVLCALLLSAVVVSECVCALTNSVAVSQASGTCTVVGQGSVPCFVFTHLSDIGTPENGTCLLPPNCAVKNCVYATKKFRVTVASCASTCINGKVNSDVTVQLHPPGSPWVSKGTLAPAGEAVFEVPPPAGLSGVCGTWTSSSYLKFFNDRGQLLYELRIDFGCANCLS
jgi:hypothetical protein